MDFMKKIIITSIIILISHPIFADQNLKKLEAVKIEFVKLYTSFRAEKELVADKKLEEIMSKLYSILIKQKYKIYKFETEKLANDKEIHMVNFLDENDEIVLKLYLWFGLTYIPDSYTYFDGDIKINERKYVLYFSVDKKTKEEEFDHYNYYFLKFSFADEDDPNFAYFKTYYTDRYEIYGIDKYENKKYFLESPIIESIIKYRYKQSPRSIN